jgi:hypothetical protein
MHLISMRPSALWVSVAAVAERRWIRESRSSARWFRCQRRAMMRNDENAMPPRSGLQIILGELTAKCVVEFA